jgi:glycolate oxidase FAD binding subunit
MVASTLAQELARILGDEFIGVGADGAIVISPKNTQEVSAVLGYATKNQLTIDSVGGGTKLAWGRYGVPPNLRLSLSRLSRVEDHSWQDLTCTVQAGCTWESMQHQLAEHDQFVALDPLFPNRATVGGVIATNDSGALRQRYGSLRDLVIGMTLVLSDGTIARTGGRVVKNVAGYDLSKLMTGSLGTLAVITEANFRLHALPQSSRIFTITARGAADLAPLLAEIRGSHLLVQFLQLRRNEGEACLDICLDAHEAARQDSLLVEMARAKGHVAREANDSSCLAREVLLANDPTFIRVSTMPTDTCAFVDELQCLSPNINVVSVSQAIGLHDIALRGLGEDISSAIRYLRARPSCTVTVLKPGPGVDAHAFTIPPPVLSVMLTIKSNFDPLGILGSGILFANT